MFADPYGGVSVLVMPVVHNGNLGEKQRADLDDYMARKHRKEAFEQTLKQAFIKSYTWSLARSSRMYPLKQS
jgi:hypothetical protein